MFSNEDFFFFLTNVEDGLPEPPSFLRDIVYPTGNDRDPRYDSDDAMPYHPPSPGRQRQVTIQAVTQRLRTKRRCVTNIKPL